MFAVPTLDWIGKSKVINHHLDVSFRILERQYSFDVSGKHEDGPDSENMIIHGDNLEALKALLPRYENRIRLIYIVIWSSYQAIQNVQNEESQAIAA